MTGSTPRMDSERITRVLKLVSYVTKGSGFRFLVWFSNFDLTGGRKTIVLVGLRQGVV